jgi:thiol-disulfide isomerase/thioredoxin
MKKTSILLIVAVVFTSLVLLNCSKKEDLVTPKYDALKIELEAKIKTVKSRETYQEYAKYQKEKLNALLSETATAPEMDSITLLKGNINVDLRDYSTALTFFNTLIEKKSDLIADAQFGKLTTLVYNQKTDEALTLYNEIKATPEIKQKKELGNILTVLSYYIKDPAAKLALNEETLKILGDSDKDQSNKATLYSQIAEIKQEQGKLDEAISYLKEAKAKLTSKRAVQNLSSTLFQLELISKDAPDFTAENWLNSKSMELAKLKGKVVLLDFWAPWCSPCRAVIPHLVKFYEQHNKDGLVIIGVTKLYGSYRDDKINKGKVKADEERKLIGEFLPRFKITYPVAIADGDTPFKTYGVRGIPTLVIIDKEGKVNKIQVGSGNEEELKTKITELLTK